MRVYSSIRYASVVVLVLALFSCDLLMGLDEEPPGKIGSLQAVTGDGWVQLSWIDPPSEDLDRILVQHDQDDSYAFQVSPGAESVHVAGLTNGVTHVFTVIALDLAGNESAPTNIAVSPELESVAPSAVTALAATAADESVILSWELPSDSDISHVLITYGSGGDEQEITVGGGTTRITIPGLANEVECTMSVRVVDLAGNISPETTVTAIPSGDTTPPAAVTNVQTVSHNRGIELSWNDPDDADLNRIEITHDQTGGSAPIHISVGVELAYVFGLTNGIEYSFELVAVDHAGNRSVATGAPAVTPESVDTTPPELVTSLSALPADGEVTLSWSDPANADGDFDHIEITHNLAGGSIPLEIAAGAETATLTGLTNEQAYLFSVRSVDISGNISDAATIAAVPDSVGDSGIVINPPELTTAEPAILGTSSWISRPAGESMLLSYEVPGYTVASQQWYVDGIYQTGANSWTLFATSFAAGTHTLSLFLYIDGHYYTESFTFTVTN